MQFDVPNNVAYGVNSAYGRDGAAVQRGRCREGNKDKPTEREFTRQTVRSGGIELGGKRQRQKVKREADTSGASSG